MSSARIYDVIIVGAGAAGLLCAALAGARGRRVLLLDHGSRAGRKILISGGGRCNFTHLHTQPQHFLSKNPHFAKSALARYSPYDFLALVERFRIAYHEKAPGQLFCDGSANQIVDMLLDLCNQAAVHIQLGTQVRSVDFNQGVYRVLTAPAGASPSPANPSCASESVYAAPALVVATGGLSIPKLGATGFGYDLARQFGIEIIPPRPALVPLVFGAEDRTRFGGLSGLATEVTLSLTPSRADLERDPISFRDKLLITHRGVSGPAVLQISSYWRPGSSLSIDLAPDKQVTAPLLAPSARRDQASAVAAWQSALPRRLAERLLMIAPPASWRTAALEAAERTLHHWPFTPAGTEGYEKAEVTAGGVSTEELSARTLESRRQKGLFFIGEVVDVTGHLGGYNFQWAWASAAAVAQEI